MDNHFSVDVRRESNVAVVALTGELDIAAAPTLEAELDAVFAARSPRMVMDLQGLEFIDSTGLSVLVKANQRAEADGITFGLAGGGTQVRRLLDLTGIGERLTVADDPAELLGD